MRWTALVPEPRGDGIEAITFAAWFQIHGAPHVAYGEALESPQPLRVARLGGIDVEARCTIIWAKSRNSKELRAGHSNRGPQTWLVGSAVSQPSTKHPRTMTFDFSSRASCVAAVVIALSTPLAAQSRARLWNGTVVTQKQPLEFYFTEGPIWNLDVAGRQIFCAGKAVHVPALIDGEQPALAGTELLDAAGVSIGPITAATFDRLVDSVAHAARDLNSAGLGLPVDLDLCVRSSARPKQRVRRLPEAACSGSRRLSPR